MNSRASNGSFVTSNGFSLVIDTTTSNGIQNSCEISSLLDIKLARWSNASCALTLACWPSVYKKQKTKQTNKRNPKIGLSILYLTAKRQTESKYYHAVMEVGTMISNDTSRGLLLKWTNSWSTHHKNTLEGLETQSKYGHIGAKSHGSNLRVNNRVDETLLQYPVANYETYVSQNLVL